MEYPGHPYPVTRIRSTGVERESESTLVSTPSRRTKCARGTPFARQIIAEGRALRVCTHTHTQVGAARRCIGSETRMIINESFAVGADSGFSRGFFRHREPEIRTTGTLTN